MNSCAKNILICLAMCVNSNQQLELFLWFKIGVCFCEHSCKHLYEVATGYKETQYKD